MKIFIFNLRFQDCPSTRKNLAGLLFNLLEGQWTVAGESLSHICCTGLGSSSPESRGSDERKDQRRAGLGPHPRCLCTICPLALTDTRKKRFCIKMTRMPWSCVIKTIRPQVSGVSMESALCLHISFHYPSLQYLTFAPTLLTLVHFPILPQLA